MTRTIAKPDMNIRMAIARKLGEVIMAAAHFAQATDDNLAMDDNRVARSIAILDKWPGFWAETTRFWLLEQAAEILLTDNLELQKRVEEKVGLGGECSPQERICRLSYRLAFAIYSPPGSGYPQDLRKHYKQWRQNSALLQDSETGKCEFFAFDSLKAIIEDFLLPAEEALARIRFKYMQPRSSRLQ
jgi:hypothetical protein